MFSVASKVFAAFIEADRQHTHSSISAERDLQLCHTAPDRDLLFHFQILKSLMRKVDLTQHSPALRTWFRSQGEQAIYA
jgi:hypothetical protein